MRVANNTEWLFYHLWKKNPDTSQCCPGLNIAETVMFRWAQPYFWYSTAKDGTLLRKTKDKVVLSQVEEVFLHNMSKCGVVATCLNSQEDTNLKAQEKIEFEYVEQNGFHNFLFQKEKHMNLIMQKFIEPKSNKNALIKVSWTPQFCIFFRKTNINDLTNTKIPLVNRLTTFEGAEHLSAADSISTPLLVSDLEHTCLSIVKHIQIVTGGNIHISKMVLYFKIDERNRLWLLFCTNLKFKDKSHLNTSKVVAKKKNQRPLSPLLTCNAKKEDRGSRNVLPHPQYVYEGPYTESNTEVCLKCGSEGLLYDLKIKMLLEYETKMMHDQHQHDLDASENFMEKFIRLEELDSKHNANVPEPMKKLFPNISDEKYMKMKSNVSFMNTPVKLCESCHLLVSEAVLDNEERRSKNIKIKLSDRSSPRNESPYLYPPSVHETDGYSHIDQLSAKSPLEGSLSPSRMHSHSSRSSRLMNQVLSKGDAKPAASKFSTYSFQAQSQLAQANVDGPRPKSGFPYIESYREKDAFTGLTLSVKEHYFRATSALSSPKEAVGTARFKNTANTLSPYAYEMNIISPQLSHRKLSMRPMTSMTPMTSTKKTQMGKKLSEVLMSPKEKMWASNGNGNGNVKKASRTNFTTMMSTIRDMKSFLEQNLE